MSAGDTGRSGGRGPGFAGFLGAPAVAADAATRAKREPAAVLERYLAELQPGTGRDRRTTGGSQPLGVFLRAIRRHGWDPALPGGAVFYPEDYPGTRRLPRALADHVMAQLEHPGNLRLVERPRLPPGHTDPDALRAAGLRRRSASPHCLIPDRDGAPYLRYFNHKMKRQALVPIDDELQAQISASSSARRLAGHAPVCSPADEEPRRGAPISSATYRDAFYRWLADCDVRDEHGSRCT